MTSCFVQQPLVLHPAFTLQNHTAMYIANIKYVVHIYRYCLMSASISSGVVVLPYRLTTLPSRSTRNLVTVVGEDDDGM